MGIIEAFGEYHADLFLRFMGLEDYPKYRNGGRLQNYLPKDRTVSEAEFRELQETAYKASIALEVYLRENPEFLKSQESKLELLNMLAETNEFII